MSILGRAVPRRSQSAKTAKSWLRTRSNTSLQPKPGWSEQNPEDWYQATINSIRNVIAKGKINPSEVKGIGLSGQMHGSVFLDKENKVIRPALLWNDQRTAAECAEIEARAGGRKKLIGMVANPALTGFTAPKILWLRNQEPKNYDKMVKCLLPKDYVRLRITGEFATEVSDASGTLLLDVQNRKWSAPLLKKLDLDASILPKVFESEEVSGGLTAEAAKLTGLPVGTAVVGGGGDQAASAVGNGIVRKGVLSARWGQRGGVCSQRRGPDRSRRPRAHVLSCGTWKVACDGLCPLRGRQPAVVSQSTRPERIGRGEVARPGPI